MTRLALALLLGACTVAADLPADLSRDDAGLSPSAPPSTSLGSGPVCCPED